MAEDRDNTWQDPDVSMPSPCVNLPTAAWGKGLAQGHTETEMDERLSQRNRWVFAFPPHNASAYTVFGTGGEAYLLETPVKAVNGVVKNRL